MPPPGDDAPTLGLLDADAGTAAPRLTEGQVLASRYRIVRFIAGGGMGEVHEAEDLQLGGRVALKVVRGPQAEAQGLERLKREIQLARRVTHRNVCRLFEFGTHELDATGRRPVAFLTMELLTGETLADRLARAGPMTEAEALPLVEQVVAGLAAAHHAGVVHRDFKTGNIVLEGEGRGQRVVVTDFGLAHDRAGEGPLARDAGGVIGTPDYMAPEQIAGREATPATDVYALGLVLYEMRLGRRLFDGGTSGALQRLARPSPPSGLHRSGLEPTWQSVITRCLAPSPEARYASPQEVLRALRSRPSRGPLAVAGLLAVLATVLLVPGLRSTRPAPVPPPSLKVRPSLAVLPFKDLVGRAENAWLQTALSEMLAAELAAGGALRIVPGENVARLRADLRLPPVDSLAAETLAQVRNMLGADVVVLGAYFVGADGRVRLDVRVQDGRSAEIVAVVTEEGTQEALLDLVARGGRRLREALGTAGLSTADALGLRASLPTSPAALKPLAEGLARLRAFDAAGARERLEVAVAAAPDHPLGHAALAEAWTLLGHDDEARAAIQRALELSSDLPRESRLSIEARHREALSDWPEAVRIYDVLFSFFPDNLEHGLRLAAAQIAAGRVDDASRSLALLRRLPAPAASDPRIDLAEAQLAEARGDYRGQWAAARRAAERASARGERLLTARARLLEAHGASRLGQFDRSRVAVEEARSIFEAAGDVGGLAWARNRGGNFFLQAGRTLEARRQYADALTLFERIGFRGGAAAAASNVHLTLLYRGELAESRRYLDMAERIDRETWNQRGIAFDLGNRSLLLHEAGELQAAARAQREALNLVEKIRETGVAAVFELRAADTQAALGRLEDAGVRYDHALAALRDSGNTHNAMLALVGKGGLSRLRGDHETARVLYQQALAARKRSGDRLWESECRLALARLALDEQQPAAVAPLLEPAQAYYAEERLSDGEAQVQALLAEALLQQEREAKARSALERALDLARRSEVPRAQILVSLSASRVARGAGRLQEARAAAGAARATAERHGFAVLALEARIEEVAAGAGSARAQRLRDLESEARQRGLLLLERHAGHLRAARE
ncbi:MAG: protein kinase [Vicinamibacteria bacterium]|nr:protein kinase [Vicinamibacteria bacterium]